MNMKEIKQEIVEEFERDFLMNDTKMEAKLYYTAPTEVAFAEMKKACLEQWATHDNTYGYADEKTKAIKDIANVRDNFMYMFAMFDQFGQAGVVRRLSPETKDAVRERMISGGNDRFTISGLGL